MTSIDPGYIRDDNSWLFADGTRLPVLSGGEGPTLDSILDTALSGGDTAPAAPEPPVTAPAGEPVPAATPAPVAAPASAEAPVAGQEPDMLPRHEVEKARREAHNLRERSKQYEEVFGTFTEDDRTTLLALVTQVRDDFTNGTTLANDWWQTNIAGALAGRQGPAAQAQAEKVVAGLEATGTPIPGDGEPTLTRAELDRILTERDTKTRQDAFVESFESDAKKLGYDLDGPRYIALTWLAANRTGSDIHKAHELLLEEFGAGTAAAQTAVDTFVAGKAAAPDSTLPGSATTPAPAGVEAPKTVKEASKRLLAFLDEQDVSGPGDRFR